MNLNELLQLYAKHPQVKVLGGLLQEGKTSPVYLKGLKASAAPMIFSSLASDEVYESQCEKGKGNSGVGLCKNKNRKADASSLKGPFLFLLDDEDSAGYFYHDLVQMLGEKQVLLFPSTYRRAVKYAQRDAANEVLRTDVLGRLSTFDANNNEWLFVVTYPAALAEKVASREEVVDHTITLRIGESYDLVELAKRLDEIGFVRRDYVYEPGEFAIRGSLLDVFSYSSEYPYRIDFFGDEIESLRTFEVQSQLSKEMVDEVSIVPDVDGQSQNLVSFTEFLPSSTRIVANDFIYFCDAVSKIYDEGFSHQAVVEKQAQVGKDAGALAEQLDKQQLLVEGEQLLRDLSPLQRIEIGPHPTGVSAAVLQLMWKKPAVRWQICWEQHTAIKTAVLQR
jgi:transcription-repair coupling factor (superfamily II helicase)